MAPGLPEQPITKWPTRAIAAGILPGQDGTSVRTCATLAWPPGVPPKVPGARDLTHMMPAALAHAQGRSEAVRSGRPREHLLPLRHGMIIQIPPRARVPQRRPDPQAMRLGRLGKRLAYEFRTVTPGFGKVWFPARSPFPAARTRSSNAYLFPAWNSDQTHTSALAIRHDGPVVGPLIPTAC